jgi:hypothetical protein
LKKPRQTVGAFVFFKPLIPFEGGRGMFFDQSKIGLIVAYLSVESNFAAMKKLLLFSLVLIALTSCDFYYLDPLVDTRNRIIGSHDVEEYSETYNDYTNYSIYIGRSGYSNEIYIDNFYAVDIRIYASVTANKIDICRLVADGYEIEGVGTIYDGEIQFNYRVKDLITGSRTDYCEATAWRY